MSEPSEWAREKARDCTYRLLKGAIVSPAFEATVRDRYARALDEARAAGREEAAKVLRVIALGSHGTAPRRTPFVEVTFKSWMDAFGTEPAIRGLK